MLSDRDYYKHEEMRVYTTPYSKNRDKILDYIKATSFKQITLARLVLDLKIRYDTACRFLKQLIEQGILSKDRVGKNTVYSLVKVKK